MLNVCGTGGWSGPLPGDPDNNSVLNAAPVFGGINVSWTYPVTNPYAVAHTLLYRGSSNDFNTAIQIAVVSGNVFFNQISGSSPITYFYWIEIVSVNGTVGSRIGPASATYSPTISSIIEGLSSQIDEGLLAQALRTKIDQITLNYQQIQAEIADRLASNAAYSALMNQLQGDINGAITVINTEVTNRTNGDNALVSQLNVLGAANSNNAGLIASETTARVSADEALAEQIDIIAAMTDANAAAIITEQQTRATADSANASSITSLQSTVTTNHTTAMSAAATADTKATNAATSAATANSLLADLSADDKLTPTEKQQIRKEWDAVVAEKTGINTQATNYAITTENTLYNDTYALLDRYLNGTTAISTGNTAGTVSAGTAVLASLTTTISLDKTYTPAGGVATTLGAGFRLIWVNFYKNRQALLNKIGALAKSLADAAQSTANTGVTNAATAQTAANSAQSTASTASSNATSALNQLTDISADDKWTPVEKQQIKLEWDGIVAEKSGIDTQVTNYNATAVTNAGTAYTNAYNLLNGYLNGTVAISNAVGAITIGFNLLLNLTTTTNLDKTVTANSTNFTFGTGARKVFELFYSARQSVLNAIAAQAKSLADAAQTKANSVDAALTNNYTTTANLGSAISNATLTAQTGYGSTLSSVSQTLQSHLNATGTRIQDIGAKYTVNVDVNGLVGGFGITNTGTSVEAGFAVNKFWIGDPNVSGTITSKKYPFIVSNGVVYMNNAMITNLGADKINTNGLVIRDTNGTPIFGSGNLLASDWIKAGVGTNLLADGSFLNGHLDAVLGFQNTGVTHVLSHNLSADYTLQGEGTGYIYRSGTPGNGTVFDANFTKLGAIPCVPGERFEISALLNPHRCTGTVIALFVDAAGVQVPGAGGAIFGNTVNAIGGTTRLLSNFAVSRVIATAPATAVQVFLIVRAVSLGQFDPYLFFSRCYIGRASTNQTEYSPWSSGGGIKRISAAKASTYIDDLAVNTLQIAGQAVTVPDIAIAAGAFTVPNFSVDYLAMTKEISMSVSGGAGTNPQIFVMWQARAFNSYNYSVRISVNGNVNGGMYAGAAINDNPVAFGYGPAINGVNTINVLISGGGNFDQQSAIILGAKR